MSQSVKVPWKISKDPTRVGVFHEVFNLVKFVLEKRQVQPRDIIKMGVTKQNWILLEMSRLPKSGSECGHIKTSSRYTPNLQLILKFFFMEIFREYRRRCHLEKKNNEISIPVNNKTSLWYHSVAPLALVPLCRAPCSHGEVFSGHDINTPQNSLIGQGMGNDWKRLGPPTA
jgi:hypothetical protein